MTVTWWQRCSEPIAMSQALVVAVSDFPCFDGSTSAEDFLAQCKRLGDLGSVAETNLGKVVAARCTGRALQVVNQLDSKELTFTAVSEALTANFSSHPTADQAAVLLSRLSKGSLSAREYGQRVKTLVRHACPEFFSEDGLVKKICVPSHDAALYRHFLVGLSPDETSLLSRMKATTFTAAMAELVREETLVDMTGTGEGDTFSTAPVARGDRPAVRWASPVRWDRSDELCYERGAPSRRRSPDGGYRRPGAEDYDPDGWAAPRGRRDGSPDYRPAVGDRRWRGRGRSLPAGPPFRRGDRRPASVSGWRSPSPGGRSPSPGGRRAGDRGAGRPGPRPAGPEHDGDYREEERGGRAAPGREGEAYRADSPGGRAGAPRCWSCRGWGHLKRHCPNGVAADGW